MGSDINNWLKQEAEDNYSKVLEENKKLKLQLANAERHMEGLLTTLRASNHFWIKKVYQNAQAGWDNNYKQGNYEKTN